jgi:hypothetical protein
MCDGLRLRKHDDGQFRIFYGKPVQGVATQTPTKPKPLELEGCKDLSVIPLDTGEMSKL